MRLISLTLRSGSEHCLHRTKDKKLIKNILVHRPTLGTGSISVRYQVDQRTKNKRMNRIPTHGLFLILSRQRYKCSLNRLKT